LNAFRYSSDSLPVHPIAQETGSILKSTTCLQGFFYRLGRKPPNGRREDGVGIEPGNPHASLVLYRCGMHGQNLQKTEQNKTEYPDRVELNAG
jgi:hypothetical protein